MPPQWLQEVANSYETDVAAQELLAQLTIQSPDDQGRVLRQGIIRQGDRLWIGANTALQTKLIAALHDSAVGGHSGIAATYQRVRSCSPGRASSALSRTTSISAVPISRPSTSYVTPPASCSRCQFR